MMPNADGHNGARIVSWLAFVVTAFIALFLPVGFFSVSYQFESGQLVAEAELMARSISRIIEENPTMWHLERKRIEKDGACLVPGGGRGAWQVFDENGHMVTGCMDGLLSPFMTRSQTLLVAGNPAGTVKVFRPMRSLLKNSLIFTLGMLPLAAGSFFIVRYILMRAIQENVKDSLKKERDRAQQYLDIASVMLVALDETGSITMINRRGL